MAQAQQEKLKKRKVKIFRCRSNTTGEEMCGIIYPNGNVRLGVDVWRDLLRNDCASWPVETYPSLDLVKRDHTMLFPTIRKYYYLDAM